jgi:predicted nucleic acid-binding protein
VETAFREETTTRIISDSGLIEWFSSFARRVRMRELSADDFQPAKAEIDGDIQEGLLRVEAVGAMDKAEAARLIGQYGLAQSLRTLDALHLAAMKRLSPERLDAVYGADRLLLAILMAEGFTVINPESPPSDAER